MSLLRCNLFFIIVITCTSLFVKCYASEPEVLSKKTFLVRGNSLEPILQADQSIEILFDYYDIYEIERGDLVAFKHPSRKGLIIKIAKGLPRDSFKLQKTESGRLTLFINDKICKNSENKPYDFNPGKSKMLIYYHKQCKGIIPNGTYLLLGNAADGSFDSSELGLIHKSNIKGKVISY